jgi:hypothetical protein
MAQVGGELPSAEALGFGVIADAAGVQPELMDTHHFSYHVAYATAVASAEGEFVMSHPKFPEDEHAEALREQFGEKRYIDGELGGNVAALTASEDASVRQVAERFVRLGAEQLAFNVMAEWFTLPEATVSVLGGQRQISFDRTKVYPLPAEPQVVVDYGPGVRGRFHTDQQITDLNSGRPAYAYIGLARGIFVSHYLAHHLKLREVDNPRAVRTIIENGLQVVRDDGIEAGTEHLLAERPGEVDIVIATGIHSARKAAVTGVRRAFELLRPKGVLMVRGPKNPPDYDPGVSIGELKAAALESGFRPGRMRSYDVTTGGPGGTRHESQAIFFRK